MTQSLPRVVRLATWTTVIWMLSGPAASAAAAAATEGSPERSRGTATERLNVILISLDTVRPDHLSCYGYQRHTTPHLDEIAQEGILFTQAFSQAPNTFPSHLSLFTSRYPTKSWVFWEAADLDPATETLTEILKRQGYATAAFTHFFSSALRPLLDARPFRTFDYRDPGTRFTSLPEGLLAWLQAHQTESFFLFLHELDAHEPHVLPSDDDAKRFSPSYDGRVPGTWAALNALFASAPSLSDRPQMPRATAELDVRERDLYLSQFLTPGGIRPADLTQLLALYDAQLYYLDQGLAHLFNALKNLDLMERTLLVIVSDHGQAFGEHGRYLSHEQCYEEVTRIVLLIRDPRLLPRRDRRGSRAESRDGRQVHQLVQGIDVMPTILELLDLPIPESAQGRSLVPLLRTGHDPGREEVAVSVGKGIRAVRTPRWMLLVKEGVPTELYDRRADPNEQHNLLARHPDLVARLQERLDAVVGKEHAGEYLDPDQWIQEHGYW